MERVTPQRKTRAGLGFGRVLLVISLLHLLPACRPAADPSSHQIASESGKVTVTYWRHYKDTEEAAMLALIQRFEEQHPGVHVRLRTFPYDVYRTKVVATLSAGAGPDIINIHNSWTYGYVKSGLILPVPVEVLSKKELANEFFPMMRSFSSLGNYYAVPVGAGNLGLFYNRALFREAGLDPKRPPRTWDELVTMAKKIARRDASGKLVRAGACIGRPEGQGWNYLVEGVLRQAGVPLTAKDLRSVRWNTAAGVAALDWFTGFITRHEVYSVMLPEQLDTFRLGLSGMTVDGPFAMGQLKNLAPDLDYGVAVLPVGPKGIRANYGTAWGNAVTRKATPEVQKVAWKFIRFIASYESMKFWCEKVGELPMRRRVLRDREFIKRIGRLGPFLEQMEYSFASVKKDETEYRIAIAEAIQEVLLNDVPPARALDTAARRINTMLARE